MHLSLALNLFAEVSAERAGRMQVYDATDQLRQLLLESGESEARNVALFEFDENIDVAVGSKIGPQYGPKEGQPSDVVPLAECSEGLIINKELGLGVHQSRLYCRSA